jgi:hypothetical protein
MLRRRGCWSYDAVNYTAIWRSVVLAISRDTSRAPAKILGRLLDAGDGPKGRFGDGLV